MDDTQGIYCVYDRLTKRSLPVFNAFNDATATRAFASQMIENAFVCDYDLLRVADINHATNIVTPLTPITTVCTGEALEQTEFRRLGRNSLSLVVKGDDRK